MINDGGTDRRGSLQRRFQRDDLEPHSCPWLTGGGEITRGQQKGLRENVAVGGSGERGRERPGRVGNIVGLNIYNRPAVRRSWHLSLPHPEEFSFQIVYITHVRVLTRLFSLSLMQCLARPHTHPTEAQAQASTVSRGSFGRSVFRTQDWRGLTMKTFEKNLAPDATYSRSSSFQGTPPDRPYVMIVFP